MDGSLPESVEIVLGTLLLLSPVAAGGVLAVWAHWLTRRGASARVPIAVAVCGAAAGLLMIATAPDGLAGVAQVVAGMYVTGVGGLVTLVCAVMTYGARVRGANRCDGGQRHRR